MKIKKYFFSPQPTIKKTNEYVDSFYESLSEKVDLINYGIPAGPRSVDFLKYSFGSDVMILNWPEDILHLRFGPLQTLLCYFTLSLYRLKGGKIVWICHNKNSHKRKHRFLSNLTRKFFTSISNYIIVHSQDALHYFYSHRH